MIKRCVLICGLILCFLTACGQPDAGSGSGAETVDLEAFYTALAEQYEFPAALTLADDDALALLYDGLDSIELAQSQIYYNQMSVNMGEIALVQVADNQDVETVENIFQSRIDSMAEGGAFYPEATELWLTSAKVVSNGNYVLMIVHEEYQAIIDDFNALF